MAYMSWHLYTLSDPRAPEHIRYIGFSKNPSDRLRRGHIQDALRKPEATHKATWLRSLLDAGLEPTLTVLPEAYDERTAVCAAEIAAIAAAKADGHDLTNGTPGGDGLLEASAEVRAKMSKAIRAAHMRDPELRYRIAARAQETKATWTAEQRAAYREASRQRSLAAFSSPEVRKKRSQQRKQEWADPEVRARRTKANQLSKQRETPEARAQRAARAAVTWSDPELRAAQSARMAEKVKSYPRRRCVDCGIESIPGPMGRHLKLSGHSGWEPAE